MNKKIKILGARLNIEIKNENLFLQALTHKSLDSKFNNEKLEFLGDRVIGLILSRKIFDMYPNEREGDLDKRFAKLVKKSTCASIIWSLKIDKLIALGDSQKKLKKEDEKILSDTCEALIAAIYLENGFTFTEKIVLDLWRNELSKSNITIVDPKTMLQEYSLKLFNKLPEYKNVSRYGPQHNPTFKISVKIDGSKKFIGIGRSKQDAEQDAAKKLIMKENIK